MSKRITSITILVVLALLTLAVVVGDALAAPSKTKFSGLDYSGADTVPGDIYFTDDGIMHIRNNEFWTEFVTNDPRMNGYVNYTFNGDFQIMPEPVSAMGSMWGTFRLDNDGGFWQGTYYGTRDKHGYSRFWYTGLGGGGYEGFKVEITYKRLDPDPTVPGDVKGFIIEI
jgi:hypothetical protein